MNRVPTLPSWKIPFIVTGMDLSLNISVTFTFYEVIFYFILILRMKQLDRGSRSSQRNKMRIFRSGKIFVEMVIVF